MQRVDALTEFGGRDHTVTIRIKQIESFLQVEVLEIEASGDFIEHHIESGLPEIESLKLGAEPIQVYLTNTLGISNPPHIPHILHSQRQVQPLHTFFELFHVDHVVCFQRIVELLECFVEADFAFTEHLQHFLDYLLLTFPSFRVQIHFLLFFLLLFLFFQQALAFRSLTFHQLHSLLFLGLFNLFFAHFVDDFTQGFIEVFDVDHVGLEVEVEDFTRLGSPSTALDTVTRNQV